MVIAAAPATTNLRTLLWRHQQAGFDAAVDRPATLLAMGLGTGKSLTTIALLDAWDAQRTLILCPKSVAAAWPGQFRQHLHAPPVVAVLTEDQCPRGFDTVAKRVVLARHLWEQTPGPLVVVLNYEAAIQPAMAKWLQAQRWDAVVADEAHKLKGHRAATSKVVHRIGKRARRRLALTGTPMPHSPLDLFGLYRFLDDRIYGLSWLTFRNTYAINNPMIPQMVVGYRHLDDLMARMATIAYQVDRDVLDLPPFHHVTRTCTLGAEGRRIYREMERDFTATLQAHADDPITTTASTVLVKVLRLMQLASGQFRGDDGTDRTVDTAKRDALAEVLDELPRDEPVVVFCKFRADLDTVRAVCEAQGRGYRELSGRANELADWQDGGGSVIGVQIQAGGSGISLTRAAYCVYLSTGYSLGDYLQSEARCHRPGQDRPVTYVHIEAEGTIDQNVSAALKDRRDVMESLLEGIRR
jgi:SNF2 family DNA or RNA helicase